MTAIEELARTLHWKMCHLDPDEEDVEWEQLNDHQRDFYLTCVRRLLVDQRLVMDALEETALEEKK